VRKGFRLTVDPATGRSGSVARVAAIVAGLGLFALAAFLAADWRFYKRYLSFDPATSFVDIDWFEPFDVVAGGNVLPIATVPPHARSIEPAALDAALAVARETGSLSLLVWHAGAMQLEWYGEGRNAGDIMESASMHKSVLALLIGIAIDDGAIASVEEPAATYIEEWRADERSAITIRNLLHMATGLGRPARRSGPFSDHVRIRHGTDWAPIVFRYGLEDPPATVFSYNNINSQVLGILLERATGRRYAEYLEEKLWSRVAESEARVFLDSPNGLARTSGSLLTPPRNWLRLGLLYLDCGRVGDEQVVSKSWMREVTAPSPLNPNYGYHVWLGNVHEPERGYGKGVPAFVPHSAPFAADDVVYFDGAGGQRVYVVPSHELVIVRTGLPARDPATGAFLWDDALLPNILIAGVLRGIGDSTEPLQP